MSFCACCGEPMPGNHDEECIWFEQVQDEARVALLAVFGRRSFNLLLEATKRSRHLFTDPDSTNPRFGMQTRYSHATPFSPVTGQRMVMESIIIGLDGRQTYVALSTLKATQEE